MDSTFRDHQHETTLFFNRSLFALISIVLLFGLLIVKMYQLQVVEYDTHTAKSNKNRIKVQPLPPTRGLIYGRNGTLLADHKPNFLVTITKEHVSDLPETLAQLTSLLSLTEDELASFKKRQARRRRPYESVPLKFKLTEAEIARIGVRLHALPGVSIEADLVRYYPLSELTAHAVGYVGRINTTEASQLDSSQYAGVHHIGKVGVEKSYEEALLGVVGYQRVETNARGKIIRVLDQTPPKPGKNLTLHIDLPTQQAATEALAGRRAALVALDPATGGVIALVSTPSFDPNLFVTGIDHKTFNELNLSRQRPLFNRTIKGQYPPGSTIKPMVGLAGIHHGVVTWEETIFSIGHYQLKGVSHQYRCWKREGHGQTDLHKAVVESCDIYFYDIAHKLTIDRLHDFLSPFGLGKATEIDIPGERLGILPSRTWKRLHRDLPWYPGETLIAGIGQGFMLATPMQLAVVAATVANKGRRVIPKVVAEIDGQPTPTVIPEEITINNLSDWDKTIQTMVDVNHGARGTARKIGMDSEYIIAGKTGTAQVLAIPQNEEYDEDKISEWHRDHALYIAFAPAEAPQIALAVIVENAGGGSTHAAPVARAVLDAYLLPRLPPKPTDTTKTDPAVKDESQ